MPATTVKLGGVEYELDPVRSESNPAHVKEKDSQYRPESQQSFWSSWLTRSWHGGERQTRILAEADLGNYAYDDAEGVDVAEWGKLRLQPVLIRTLTIQSATMPMTVASDGSAVYVGTTTSTYMKKSVDGTAWTDITTPNAAAVTCLMTSPMGTMYGVQGTHIITSTNGTTWTNDASTGVPTDMVAVTWCAGRLYALGASYLKYWDGAAWVSATALMGGSICTTFQENVYFAKNDCLFKWTGQTAFQDDRMPAGFVITALIPYRKILWICGYFLVQGAKRGAVFYIVGGYESHLFSIKQTNTSSDYGVRAAAGSDDEMYIGNQKRGGADRYDLTGSGLSSGPAWTGVGFIPPMAMAYFNGYLVVGRYDNAAGTDGIYCANVANPATYVASGWLATSEFDFGFPHDYKAYKSITVGHKALAAGEIVKVEYSVDTGVAYKTAGNSASVGAVSKTFTLPDCRGRSFKVKLTLYAGTSAATTPTVTELRVDAAPMAGTGWTWRLRLSLRRQGSSKIKNLELAAEAVKPMPFEDFMGDKSTVIIDGISIGQSAADETAAMVNLSLRGVN